MSTYSWSYKNTTRRPKVTKNVANDVVDNIEAASSEGNDAKLLPSVITGLTNSGEPPKRLNWRAKLYVGNLSRKTTEASLGYYFSIFGDLADLKLIRDQNTNESRGFAFVTFEKVESAEKAKKWCSYNYPVLDDSSITVASAERKIKKPVVPSETQLTQRDPNQTLFWEYKWNNDDDTQVYGPYETSLMLTWKNQGFFNAGCWVRQVHSGIDGETLDTTDPTDDLCSDSIENAPEKDDETVETPSKKRKQCIIPVYSDSDDSDTEREHTPETKRMSSTEENKRTKNVEEKTPAVKNEQPLDLYELLISNLDGDQCGQSPTKAKTFKSDIGTEAEIKTNAKLDAKNNSALSAEDKSPSLRKEEVRSQRNEGDSSSDDEAQSISTEFVPISDIDFTLFP